MLLTAVVLFAAVAQSSDGVPIHYTDQGKSEPALVFAHCWACDRHLWDAHVAVFSKNHRVVAIDLPGHGESGKNRYLPARRAARIDPTKALRAE
jgi:pimeloyl-ACP methyl ester carboxylesterase